MTARVWVPTGLGSRKDLASLAYVVVEEIESDFVGLTVSPWPTLDRRGRLHFDLERSREIGARKRALQAFLGKSRTPKKLARRPLRIGDVFACAIRGPLPDGALLAPEAWMVAPVTDVSAQAREAAKIAFFSAAAPLARPEADREIVTLAPKSAPLKATRSPTGPDPFGTAGG
jgi:hypothetical protein